MEVRKAWSAVLAVSAGNSLAKTTGVVEDYKMILEELACYGDEEPGEDPPTPPPIDPPPGA